MGSNLTNEIESRPGVDQEAFMKELRAANPRGAELLDRNRAKANIAMSLRELRKARKMTQEDVSVASGLPQPMISRLESPLGPMPALDSVMRYAAACDAHAALGFRFDERVTPELAEPEGIMMSVQDDELASPYSVANLV